MRDGAGPEKWQAAVPVVLALASFFVTAAGRAILDADEAVYAHVPQQMLERGDWVTPYANGVRFFDKPPMLYWLLAISYQVFGVHDFAARIPSILGVAGTTLLVQRMGSMAAGPRAGTAAAAAFAFSLGTYFFTLEIMHDIALVFFLTLAMYGFLLAYRHANPWPVLCVAVAMAGAFLSKGIIGAAFPAAIVLVYLLLSRDVPPVRRQWLLLAGFAFLILSAPWHVAMEIRNPGFLRAYFFEEQILRFFQKREPLDYDSVPLLPFLALIPVWLFPWSAFLPPAMRLLRVATPDAWLHRIGRLAIVWAGVILAFFSLSSSRLEHYTFGLIPPLALLAGVVLAARPPAGNARYSVRSGFNALAVFGWLFLAAFLILAVAGAAWTKSGADGAVLRPDSAYPNHLTQMLELPVEIRQQLLWPALAVTLAFGAGLPIARIMATRQRPFPAILALLLSMMVFQFSAAHSLRACEPVVSSRHFGLLLRELAGPGDRVVIRAAYETGNSINFYAPQPIYLLETEPVFLRNGLRYPDAPDLLLSREKLSELWNSPERVFLIINAAELAGTQLEPIWQVDVYAGRVLVSNQMVSRRAAAAR